MDDMPEVAKIAVRIEYTDGRVLEIGAERPDAAWIDHGELHGDTMTYGAYFALSGGRLPDLRNDAPGESS